MLHPTSPALAVVASLSLATAAIFGASQSAAKDRCPAPVRGTGLPSSMQCLGCHDGSAGTDVPMGPLNPRHGAFQAHRVGTPYARAALRMPETLLPAQMLDSRVRLEEGRVECTTCHDPGSPRKGKLVMSNAGSRLCLACHPM